MNDVIAPSQCESLFNKAQHYMPGGVNSPVRAFNGVGGEPKFIHQAEGAYLIDSEGKRYIDYVGSWGPMILGHANPSVIRSVQQTANLGLSFGAPCELEINLAEIICRLMPSIEKIRMVNSGTEATMTAIRLARGATGRDKIIKFEGCYHGHSDSLLVKAGSGALTLGCPSSPGVPKSVAEDTLVATYNDLDSVTKLFEQHPDAIAGLIIEPIAGNMNLVLPQADFLKGIRQLCDQYNALLIVDEVMTGFRVARGGAQSLYNIRPDITTLGKIIGGGMPVGALGGRADLMNQLAPIGPIYQAGTLSGNPIAMAAGLATLQQIERLNPYPILAKRTTALIQGLTDIANSHHVALKAQSVGSMFGLYFTDQESIQSFNHVMQCKQEQFKQFFHGMLNNGVYFAPSAFEAGFVSACHEENEINKTLDTAERVFANWIK